MNLAHVLKRHDRPDYPAIVVKEWNNRTFDPKFRAVPSMHLAVNASGFSLCGDASFHYQFDGIAK
jgi:hypothetical protein